MWEEPWSLLVHKPRRRPVRCAARPQPGPALHQGIKAPEDVAGLWSQGGHHCEVAGELSAGLEEPACSLPLCLETKECPDWELSPATL